MLLYFLLIVGIACSRVYEVKLSKRHLRTAQKDRDVYPLQEKIYGLMVGFHTCWLFACIAEVYFLNRHFLPFWGTLMIIVWVITLSGRLWMLTSMKDSWNVRVISNPTQDVISTGPYQYIRHPNYLIVIIEIFSIPMIHSAYLTALIGTVLNAFLIWARLRTEEPYLAALPVYNDKVGHLPRFIPKSIQNLTAPFVKRSHS